jgi:hypothetical protein
MDEILRQRQSDYVDETRQASVVFKNDPSSLVRSAAVVDAIAFLGLQDPFTKGDLQIAYRRLGLICHPDKPGGSRAAFNELKRAYKAASPFCQRVQLDAKAFVRDRDDGVRIPRNEIKDFNRTFEESGACDHGRRSGHEEWLRQSVPDEARAPENVAFKDFHRVFDVCNKAKVGTIVCCDVGYTSLNDSMHMASIHGETGTVFEGAGYSDLQMAYGKGLLN